MDEERPVWRVHDDLYLVFALVCAFCTWLSIRVLETPDYGSYVLALGAWGLGVIMILPGMYCWLGLIRPKDPMPRLLRWGGVVLFCLPFLRLALS